MTYAIRNEPLPTKYNRAGRPVPHSKKDYFIQGWNAAQAGLTVADCPYYATSTASENWIKGVKS